MATKTTFFGTIFTFNEAGVNDVIRDFRNGYEEAGEDAPFIGYDPKHDVFKIDKLELLDETTPVDLLRQLEAYTREHGQNNDVLDPKIQTREGFSARLATEYGDVRQSDLLDLDLDDPEESTADAIKSLQQFSLEWKPRSQNTKILTNSVAQRIASTTGAFLNPDSTHNYVRLLQNNVELASQKLINIEPLLQFQYERRNSEASRPVPNLLLSTDEKLKPLLGFQRLNFDRCPSYQRVIVPPHLAPQLPDKYVCEGRIFQEGRKLPHPNLDLAASDATDRLSKSSIWDRYKFREAGDPAASKAPTDRTRAAPSEVGSIPRIAPQKYLGLSKAAELQDWSGNIAPGANPNEIEPEEPPVEQTSRRRRRVAVDSDDEDEVPTAPVVRQAPIFDIESDIQPQSSSGANYPSNFAGDDRQTQHAFEDDGQLLEGLPYDEPRPQFSPAPSQLPSNLMSLASSESPYTSGSAYRDGRLNGHSSSSSHFAADCIPQNASSAGNIHQASRGRGKAVRSRGDSLVGAQTSSGSMRPPPGLSFPPSTLQSTAPSEVQWSEVMRRSDEPEIDRSVLEKFSRRKEPAAVDETSKHWVNTTKTAIDSDARRDEALARMQRRIEMQQQQSASSASGGSQTGWSTVSNRGGRQKKSRGGGRQRKADDQQPRFHNTMRQQAPNPGKRGDKSTGASRKKKIDQILGSVAPVAEIPPSTNGPSFSDMSKSKQKLLGTNPTMAHANMDAVQQGRRVEEAVRLKSLLEPYFEHARAFSGKLDFGLNFGQVLLPTDPHTNKAKTFGVKQWNQTFGADAGPNVPMTCFTPILTSNGADLDRALEMKHSDSKLFDKTNPGPSSITFEFQCENASGEKFLVDVREDLTYDIHHSTDNIGMVCMQCPAQVWDACARLQGTEPWIDPRTGQPPEAEANAVRKFVEGIYIPAGHKLKLYFHRPEGNVMTVKNLMMKRVSLHGCLLPGYEDIQLRVTEYTSLSMRTSPNNKRLCSAVELDHDKLYSEDAIQYEMSLVDSSISAALQANNDLEIGELTDPSLTGKSLLKEERVQRLLDLTVSVLTKIDWMGMHNVGTMIRLDQKRAKREQSLTLPPALQSQLYMPASRLPSQYAGTVSSFSGSQTGTEMPRLVHGTRAGTRAVLQRDEAGWFQKGLGGARVPVPDAQLDALDSLSEDMVLPEDSASQVGMPRVANDAGGVGAQRRVPPLPWNPVDDKPQGFW